jgi:ketosteroid isomerase-like protein
MRYSTKSKVHLASCFGCVALLLACGCNTSKHNNAAADEATIMATDAQWSKAAESNDIKRTMAFYTDDALLLSPNEPLHTDSTGRKQSWAGLLTPANRVSWKVNKVSLANSGDMGYSSGSYVLANRLNPEKPPFDHGKFLEVWKKQTGGSWKCVADVFNSDVPLPTPAVLAVK